MATKTLIESTRRDGVMRKGEWRGAKHSVEGTRSALACCPSCGKICSLLSHTIDPDGTVTPSLVCPFDNCEFHDFVKLADWRA
jgi:hypothetical protein